MTAKGHFFANKMIVELNVFGTGMKDWVGGHVRSTEVVTMKHNGKIYADTKFKEEIA